MGGRARVEGKGEWVEVGWGRVGRGSARWRERGEVGEGMAAGEVVGHMLAAAVAREDENGASGNVGPDTRARRRRRNWQVAACSSKDEAR